MRAFVAVAEAGGYSAAARKVGRSKALLSKYVRDLEDELGALLLNRTTRKLSLTAAGEIYRQRAIELIREIDGLGEMVRDQTAATGGLVRLSAPRALADSGLGEALIDFTRTHRAIDLNIDLSDRFVDLVEEGFDLAIRVAVPEDSTLIAKRLAPMRLLVVASPALIDRTGHPAAPADLTSLPAIVDTNSRVPGTMRFRGRDGEPINVSVGRGRLTANSPVMALRAARAGLGFAMVPDFIALDALAAGEVVEVLEAYRSEEMAIHALYPHRRHQTQRVRLLIDYLAEWFGRRAG